MFGLTFEKLILVGMITAVIVGPSRLPRYAQLLADTVRSARRYAETTRSRVESEMGVEPDDWQRLDPRRYDPRRIIREALDDRGPSTDPGGAAAGNAAADPNAADPKPVDPNAAAEPSTAEPHVAESPRPRTAVSNDLARLAEISRARAERAQAAIADAPVPAAETRELV